MQIASRRLQPSSSRKHGALLRGAFDDYREPDAHIYSGRAGLNAAVKSTPHSTVH